LIFGRPLPTSRLAHERLPKFLALPIFSSDALSSNAYAPEAILSVLVTASIGLAALNFAVPVAAGISILMAIVVLSYRQIIFAYPDGGGAYPVSRDNLGAVPALVAGASLLVDYVLTVATSVAAGVAAITTALPALQPHLEFLCQVAILLVMLANLRGAREAGWLFAGPAYLFIVSIVITVVVGLGGIALHVPYLRQAQETGEALHRLHATASAVGWYLILRAFSMGCAALTGVEAISNTVPLFKEPRDRNAAATTVLMGVLAIIMFMGLAVVTWSLGVRPMLQTQPNYQTVVGQVANIVWQPHALHWMFYIVQLSTALILVIAANAAFAGFPQLASMLARDGYLPRQLSNVGDRLAFSNGIIVLSLVAMALIHIFHGIVDALLSLYAIGVFMSFTLAQIGMVRRWLRTRDAGWGIKLVTNAVGAAATGIVTVIIGVSKFADGDAIFRLPAFSVAGRRVGPFEPHYGAWLVILIVPLMVLTFLKIRRHYDAMRQELALDRISPVHPTRNTVLVLVPRVHRGVIDALNYARLVSSDVRGVHVEVDPAATPQLKKDWEQWAPDIPLLIFESPFRSLVSPILQYIAAVQEERADDFVTVIVPELVTHRWWHRILHNQAGPLLRAALAGRRDVVVTNVRYFLEG
jgi:amino acid transporter